MPSAPSTFGTQACTSFETNVLPAPVRLPPAAFELVAPAPPLAVKASTAISASTMASFLVKSLPPLVLVRRSRTEHALARVAGGLMEGVDLVTEQ